jgi:hypothetical protein
VALSLTNSDAAHALNFFLLKAKRNKSLFFPTLKESFGQGSRRKPAAHKKQNTSCVLLKGKTMPLPSTHNPFFAFCFTAAGEKA